MYGVEPLNAVNKLILNIINFKKVFYTKYTLIFHLFSFPKFGVDNRIKKILLSIFFILEKLHVEHSDHPVQPPHRGGVGRALQGR